MIDLHATTWVARNRYELRPGATRFENWETNQAGKVGLGAAIESALELGDRGDLGTGPFSGNGRGNGSRS